MRSRNKTDGGWGFKPGYRSDVKCTAMAVMALLMARRHSLESPDQMVHDGLQFLLDNQKEDGSWPTVRHSRDSAVFSSFYAIETFLVEKYLYYSASLHAAAQCPHDPQREQLEGALNKALTWYQFSTRFLPRGDQQGWGWEDHVKSSGVENTACALIVLLDTGWMRDDAPLIQRTLDWLLKHRHPENLWGAQTPLILMGIMRIVEPTTRLDTKIKHIKTIQQTGREKEEN